MKKHLARRDGKVSSERSAQMALIRGRDTKPELLVRKALHGAGLRFRLHRENLPGRPDIVLRSRKTVVFVHGCFWHRHKSLKCKLARLPKSRLDFWIPKLEGNAERDKRKQTELNALGWRVMVIWECEISSGRRLEQLARAIGDISLVRSNMERISKSG